MNRLRREIPVKEQDLDQVYLRFLSRPPTQRERELCKKHPIADITYALLNSDEFVFNH